MIMSILLVAAMAGISLGSTEIDAFWRNSTGDGDFCNAQNWDENPPASNDCFIDSQGITHASCDIDISLIKGPSYETPNITSELSSGTIRVSEVGYCRIGYYAGGGHLIISGGTLECRCDADEGGEGFVVGLNGQGTLTVTDGLVTAKTMFLATPKKDGTYGGGTSVVNLSGGVIEADGLDSQTGQASFIISGTGKLVLPGQQSLGSLPGWVTFEGEGVAEYDTPEYPGRTVFMVQGVCPCPGNVNRDTQVDLDDLQSVADILLAEGSPFVVLVGEGDCGDTNADGQIDLDDLQAVADILLAEGSPFVVACP